MVSLGSVLKVQDLESLVQSLSQRERILTILFIRNLVVELDAALF